MVWKAVVTQARTWPCCSTTLLSLSTPNTDKHWLTYCSQVFNFLLVSPSFPCLSVLFWVTALFPCFSLLLFKLTFSFCFVLSPIFCFIYYDSCLLDTPQVVHSFVTTELQSKQSSTKKPAITAEGYLMCQCFPYMQWKHYTLSYLEIDFFFITTICIIATNHHLRWVTEILVILFKGCNRRLIKPGWS